MEVVEEMPPVAQRNGPAALDHILTQVLSAPANSSYHQALDELGVMNSVDFVLLSIDDLKTVLFGPDAKKLKVVEVKKLMKLFEWFQHQEDPHVERWFELTQEKFASFIASSSKSPSIGNSGHPSLPSHVLEPLTSQEVHSISSPPMASPVVNTTGNTNSLAMELSLIHI